MQLTKLELQEMLREMGVRFSPKDSYKNLKALFQQENHLRWMRSLAEKDGGKSKKIVRKKPVLIQAPVPTTVPEHSPASSAEVQPKPAAGPAPADGLADRSPRRPRFFRKIHTRGAKEGMAAAKPIFDRTQNVFEIVLRRAKGRCELCGQSPAGQQPADQTGLRPFHILPPAMGGEDSIKNIAALCPACHSRMQSEGLPAEIKQLKRKARAKIISEVTVERKST
jgi:5-methylcytosine-specific restriction enzyme A